MRKLILILCLLVSCAASAQVLQLDKTFGREYYRLANDSLLSLPLDTFRVATNIRGYGWMARKSGTLYLWNTSTFIWEAFSGGSGGGTTNTSLGSGYKTAVNGTNNIKSLVGRSAITLDSAVSGEVGFKLGGSLVGVSTITGNNSVAGNAIVFNDANFRVTHTSQGNGQQIGISNNATIVGSPSGTNHAYSNYGGGWMYTRARDSIQFSAGDSALGAALLPTYLSIYPHRIYGYTDSAIVLGSARADQYANDSLLWRSTNRHTQMKIFPDSMAFYQNSGEYYVYDLNRELDTTGLDLMAWDRAGSEWVRIPSSIVGTIPGLQSVITAGPTLTGSNNIFVGTDIQFVQSANTRLGITGSQTTIHSPNLSAGIVLTNGNLQMTNFASSNQIILSTDSMYLQPYRGRFNIDTLNSSNNGNDSMMVWNPNGRVGMRTIPSSSSGLTVGTTAIANSNTRSLLYDSSGILKTHPLLLYNTSGELQLGATADAGAFILQVTGASNFTGAGTFGSLLTVNNTVLANAFQTSSTGGNSNFFTSSTTGTSRSTGAPYLFKNGAGSASRIWINGTTATIQTAGDDYGQMIVGRGVFTEAGSGTHPRGFGLAVFGGTVTGGAAATDTLVGLYVDGPPTGVTAGTGSWNTIYNFGDVLIKNGNVTLGTAGNKLSITTGTNASMGVSGAMTAGSITISTTAVTASSRIFLTHSTLGGTQGVLSVGTVTAGTSFVINSSSALDTGTVNWWIVN